MDVHHGTKGLLIHWQINSEKPLGTFLGDESAPDRPTILILFVRLTLGWRF